MEKVLSRVDAFSSWSGKVLSYLVLPMIGVIVYTSILRYFFDIAVDWGFEMSIFIYGVHCILGGAFALRTKGHIAVDILPSRLPPGAQRAIEIFSYLVILAVCLIMLWMGSIWAWKSTVIWERSIHQTVFNPPIWWFKWMVPLAAGLLVLQALAEAVRAIFRLPLPRKEETP